MATVAQSASHGPAVTQFAYRTAKEIGVVDAASVYQAVPGFNRPQGNIRFCAYSPNGRFFAWAAVDSVSVVNASSGSVVATLSIPNVLELAFSPFGTFLQTWERPGKDDNGDATKNLKIWQLPPGGEPLMVGRFVQKAQSGWNLQYTPDEHYCARLVTNEVQIYESGRLDIVWNKLRAEGVQDFAIAPGKRFTIGVFIPERKGQPAGARIYDVPNFERAIAQKSFYKADKVTFKWNQNGTSLLVLTQTEVDKTGKSYYGETNAYLMSTAGGQCALIQLDKEGPIHDVAWSPNSREFGIVYGYMPAKTTIFNLNGDATYSFPLSPRNTILFSPHGRYLLVAGFGNLAGQMEIFDLERNYTKVTTIVASNASVCEWSPDGRHILVATTSPRLRVDNGVRIWHMEGELQYNEDLTELYNVTWRPQPPTAHPLTNSRPTPHPSAQAYQATIKTPSKPAGAYRPPGARGEATPIHFKREDEGGAAYVSNGLAPTTVNGFGANRAPRRREVPGAEPLAAVPGAAPGGGVSLTGDAGDEGLSKAALKNKKKREARKARDAGEKTDEGLPAAGGYVQQHARQGSPSKRGHERNKSRGGHGQAQSLAPHHVHNLPVRNPPPVETTPVAPPPVVENVTPDAKPVDDKRVRALVKKLRAIDELKLRHAGNEKLEDTQVKKIATEDSVRKELESLGWDG